MTTFLTEGERHILLRVARESATATVTGRDVNLSAMRTSREGGAFVTLVCQIRCVAA